MVRLFTWGAEQYVQGIANDLRNRTIVRKDKVGHAYEIVVEKWPQHVGFKRLHKCGEAVNVGEQRRNLTTPPAQINRIRIVGKPRS